MKIIGIAGAGAWGTALAVAAHHADCRVLLWAREDDVVTAIRDQHENTVFLPGIALPDSVQVTPDMAALNDCDAILQVTPAQYFRSVCREMKETLSPEIPIILCAKGIEQKTGFLMGQIIEEEWPEVPYAILSGPTFAQEVARGLPTAVTLAAKDKELAKHLVDFLSSPVFHLRYSDDVVGAQIGGAIKNVLAIACGIAQGKGLGENARAALITCGLSEMVSLGQAFGAREETLRGMCGLGDLVLTCNSMQSRNFSLGAALGAGQTLTEILGNRIAVTEGVYTAAILQTLAKTHNISMPVCQAVDQILNHQANIEAVIQGLLNKN